MAKRLPRVNKTADAHKIFRNGEAFYEAWKILMCDMEKHGEGAFTLVFGTIMCFATELFLKCLLRLENGQFEEVHYLDQLFYKLKKSTQDELRAEHDKYIATNSPSVQEARKAGLAVDIHSALKCGRDCFVNFRYAFDEKPTSFGLGAVLRGARRRILDLHPEWTEKIPKDL